MLPFVSRVKIIIDFADVGPVSKRIGRKVVTVIVVASREGSWVAGGLGKETSCSLLNLLYLSRFVPYAYVTYF